MRIGLLLYTHRWKYILVFNLTRLCSTDVWKSALIKLQKHLENLVLCVLHCLFPGKVLEKKLEPPREEINGDTDLLLKKAPTLPFDEGPAIPPHRQ